MFRNLKISTRLFVVMAAQLALIAIIGSFSVLGLKQSTAYTAGMNERVVEQTRLSNITGEVHGEWLFALHGFLSGDLGWREATASVKASRERFEEYWETFYRSLSLEDKEVVDDNVVIELDTIRAGFAKVENILENADRKELGHFLEKELSASIDPFLNAITATTREAQLIAQQEYEAAAAANQRALTSTLLAFGLGALLAISLGFSIYHSIAVPLRKVSEAVDSVTAGDYEARSGVTGVDELGQLGSALDALLEEKVSTLVRAEEDNLALNNSVMSLLEGVAQLGERDLTVTVPVTQDVTGPVADAVNAMAEETAKVLKRVSAVAQRVQAAAKSVNEKAASVNQAAEIQRLEVERATEGFAQTAESFSKIAEVAKDCNAAGEQAGNATREARQSVSDSLRGMDEIRESIQETAKRIKRLGDRSSEITSVVDIINTIAERTHVLALNASMQAAAAGEAGRGFAVVADEVQRLAESARESTAQISSLVKNIHIDTTDTISTMDRTIEQVVEGTRLAEVAEQRMAETENSTLSLIDSVKDIATQSEAQQGLATGLKEGAMQAVARTRATAKQIVEQITQTKSLVEYAEVLLKSVKVFKLPV